MKPFDAAFGRAGPQNGSATIIPLRRRREETAFLPAALAIVETPASPLGRAIGASIMVFFCLALIWSIVGRVDEVATAPGKVVPSANIKLLQPLQSGVVTAIHAQDGGHVDQGQILVELDRKTASAERDKLADQLLRSRLETAQLMALKAGLEGGDPATAFTVPEGASPEMIQRARAALMARAAAQLARNTELDQEIAQKMAEADEVAATISKLQATMPILAAQVDVRKQAMDIQFGNKLSYLQAEQSLVELQNDVIIEQKRAVEAMTARRALERQREQAAADYARVILDDLGGAEERAATQRQDLIRAEEQLAETTLTAPISGTVQQLAVHTVGGVVTPAQPLLVIVPDDSELTVEAQVQNRDVGFVHAGDDVEVKVETFTFTRYGLLHGRVVSLNRDAAATEPRAMPDDGLEADRASGPPGSPEPTYVARIKLDQDSIKFDGKEHLLSPGMAVTAEIKTGQRRVIDYLLSPLQKYNHEALTER